MFLLLVSSLSSLSCPLLLPELSLLNKSSHLIPLHKTAKMHFSTVQEWPNSLMIPQISPSSASSLQLLSPPLPFPYSSKCHTAAMPKDLQSSNKHITSCLLYVLLFTVESLIQKVFPFYILGKIATPFSKPNSSILLGSFLCLLYN